MSENEKQAERWRQSARETRDTARQLRESTDTRSCVSRAYYAVYQLATATAIAHGDAPKFPPEWNNPTHDQLPELIANNGDLSLATRRTVRRLLR